MIVIDNKKKYLYFLVIILIGGSIYLVFWGEINLPVNDKNEIILKHNLLSRECLEDTSLVNLNIERLEKNATDAKYNEGVAHVSVRQKTDEKISSFDIENVTPGRFYFPGIQKCGIYIIRTFGYDYQKKIPLQEYRRELWMYAYDGSGRILMTDSAKWSHESTLGDFRIDPSEHYLVLAKGYLGSPDYSIVVKNLETLEDIFILPITEIKNRKPDIVGDMGFESTSSFGWTKNGHYFWARTSSGANTLGFIRIDTQTWQTDLLSAPKDILGGDVLNFENGYITVHSGNVWYGIAEITEKKKEERRKQGIGTELYIYNLITGEKQFVAKTDEPLWYFSPRWISDAELRYIESNNERRVYEIK